MSDDRVERACEHMRRGLEKGDPDEYRAAQSIVRKLEQELRESPEGRARRARLEAARKAEQALAGPAAAYSRYLKKSGRA